MIREEWDEEEGIFEAYSGGTICGIGQTGGKLYKWETSRQFWETSRIPPKRGTGVKTEGVAKTPEDIIDGGETQVVDPIVPRKIMGPRSSLQVVPNRGN